MRGVLAWFESSLDKNKICLKGATPKLIVLHKTNSYYKGDVKYKSCELQNNLQT